MRQTAVAPRVGGSSQTVVTPLDLDRLKEIQTDPPYRSRLDVYIVQIMEAPRDLLGRARASQAEHRSGPIDAFINNQSLVLKLAVVEVSLMFTREGLRG